MKHPRAALSVSLQPRDGGWIKLGTGTRYQVVPESISFDGDLGEYGCLSARWKMTMNPRFPHLELEHFTPVLIESGAEHVWSGRIISTPTQYGEDSVVNVEAQGWGQHTKDDAADRTWIVSDLSRWVDARSIDAQVLSATAFAASGTVDAGRGVIRIALPPNGTYTLGQTNGAVLDLGPNGTAAAIAVMWDGGGGGYNVCVCTSSDGKVDATTEQVLATIATGGTSTVTFSTPKRYVLFYTKRTAATVTASTAEAWARLSFAAVATSSSYLSGNASALKASTIIGDTLTELCPLVSSDRSLISATSFNVPQFPASSGWRYANEYIDNANAFHGWQFLLSPDPTPVATFRAVPTLPAFVVGIADDYHFENPSQSDGRSVFSRVVSEYTAADGQQLDASLENTWSLSSQQAANPGFESASLASWTPYNGSLTRDTAVFDVGLASGRMGTDATGVALSETQITGLSVGKMYRFTVRVRRAATMIAGSEFRVVSGATQNVTSLQGAASGAFQTFTVDHYPTTSTASVQIYLATGVAAVATAGYVDEVTVTENRSTVVGLRGFRRTALRPMGGASNATAASSIASLELDAAQYPPLKGSLALQGRVRRMGGGTSPVSILPSMVGEVILIENLEDPNTGALGRQGVIKRAAYDESTDTATVEIDDPSDFIDNLRARLGAFVK